MGNICYNHTTLHKNSKVPLDQAHMCTAGLLVAWFSSSVTLAAVDTMDQLVAQTHIRKELMRLCIVQNIPIVRC